MNIQEDKYVSHKHKSDRCCTLGMINWTICYALRSHFQCSGRSSRGTPVIPKRKIGAASELPTNNFVRRPFYAESSWKSRWFVLKHFSCEFCFTSYITIFSWILNWVFCFTSYINAVFYYHNYYFFNKLLILFHNIYL